MSPQEWRERFKNAYDIAVELGQPEMRMNFTISELKEITLMMIKLKHYEEHFERDTDI